MLTFPVTVITLFIAFLFPYSYWFRHTLIANSIVGLLYTLIERDAIYDDGFGVLGRRVYVSNDPIGLHLINLVSHVLLPTILLSRYKSRRSSVVPSLVFYIACRVLIDVRNTYPSRVHPMTTYTDLHMFVFVMSILVY